MTNANPGHRAGNQLPVATSCSEKCMYMASVDVCVAKEGDALLCVAKEGDALFLFSRHQSQGKANAEKQSHMLDLLDVNLGNPSPQQTHAVALDPWGFPQPVSQSPPTRPQVCCSFLLKFH